MIKTILIVLVVILVAALIYAATKPDTFRVQRSITIKATPETIFPLINDLHSMQTWSAWEKVDPGMNRTYSGAASGPGAVYEWEGNQEIGQGRMEILDATPPAKITLRMDFIKPFPAQNTLEFVLQIEGDSTRVTQAIFGPSPYLSKVMSLVFSMDKMIGGKFAESLAELKTIAEKQSAISISEEKP